MLYGGEILLPLRSGYVPEIPRSVTETLLPGGPSSQRRITVRPITTVKAEYLLTSCFMIQWYKAWYRRMTTEGADTFTARLAIDNAVFDDYVVQFSEPPTIIHNGYRGLLRVSYEVLSRAPQNDCDHLALYGLYGNCSTCVVGDVNDALQW